MMAKKLELGVSNVYEIDRTMSIISTVFTLIITIIILKFNSEAVLLMYCFKRRDQ